jgi:rRNA maturation protein Nop10
MPSRDFVPERIPKPLQSWHTNPARFGPENEPEPQDGPRECVLCAALTDEPTCPECGEYTVPIPGAQWDDD